MRYRELGAPGRPGLRVSEIGLGTREIGGTIWLDEEGEKIPHGFGIADDDASVQMMARARQLGMNFIMTSPAHGDGHGQEVIGRAIARDRDYWVVGAMGGVGVEDGKLKSLEKPENFGGPAFSEMPNKIWCLWYFEGLAIQKQ